MGTDYNPFKSHNIPVFFDYRFGPHNCAEEGAISEVEENLEKWDLENTQYNPDFLSYLDQVNVNRPGITFSCLHEFVLDIVHTCWKADYGEVVTGVYTCPIPENVIQGYYTHVLCIVFTKRGKFSFMLVPADEKVENYIEVHVTRATGEKERVIAKNYNNKVSV